MTFAHTSESTKLRDLPPTQVLFGQSPQMAVVREKLERASTTTVPVLLQGESGTGKDVFAKLLHTCSNRTKKSFVKVACPAFSDLHIESELFGDENSVSTGAYTIRPGRMEQAHMGTLFLDEIGDLDMTVQAKLLQMLQNGTFTRVGGQELINVNTRLVSSTSKNLLQLAKAGNFRMDFFFHISAVTIQLPALRQRIADLPILIDYFFDLYSRAYCRNAKPLSRDIMSLMLRNGWPGNIRQLENMIRSYILIGSEKALVEDLVSSVLTSSTKLNTEIDLTSPISLKELTKAVTLDMERQIILKVLAANAWSRLKTAKWLNISYRSLLYKMKDFQIVGNLPRRSEQKHSVQVYPATSRYGSKRM
jgi:two-component system, NtrC family, response regulator AtoC